MRARSAQTCAGHDELRLRRALDGLSLHVDQLVQRRGGRRVITWKSCLMLPSLEIDQFAGTPIHSSWILTCSDDSMEAEREEKGKAPKDNANGNKLPDGDETLKYHLLGPSLTKAGQDSVDQQRVSRELPFLMIKVY